MAKGVVKNNVSVRLTALKRKPRSGKPVDHLGDTEEVRAGELASRVKEAMETVSTPIMTVDRDFIVTYVNAAATTFFRKNSEAFGKLWPTFNPDQILGVCIDTFHK